MHRFYFDGALGGDVTIEGGEFNHLVNVLRVGAGERVIGVSCDDFDYEYEVASITRAGARLRFIEKRRNLANPGRELTVYLGLIKHDKLAQAVTQLNEVGVSEIVVFNCERSNVALKSVSEAKLNEVARQSCKQCFRSRPAVVRVVSKFPFEEARRQEKIIFARTQSENEIDICGGGQQGGERDFGGATAVIIGPEGGFTPDEDRAFRGMRNVFGVTLGARVLRAETAAVVFAGLVLNAGGGKRP